MRFVTLGRRCLLTEGMYHALKLGLFPFGWDYESLICLNPADLDSPPPIILRAN